MRSFLGGGLVAVLLASSAWAQSAPRESRLVLNHFAVLRLHPLGADLRETVTFVNPIGDSEDRLWKTRFWSVGATATINPAEGGLQAFFEFEPIAVFQVRAMAEYRGYFGTFNELLSFPTLAPEIDDQIIRDLGTAGENNATTRWTLRVDPKVRLAFGPIGFQNVFTFAYANEQVPAGHLAYYDSPTDVIRPVDGVTLTNTASLVYLGGPLTAGVVHEWHLPWGLDSDYQVHRVGGVASFVFYDSPGAALNKPTVFALAQFNVIHPFRVSYLPTFVVGFSAETDLLAKR